MKMRKLTYFKIQSVFQLYFDDEGLINHTKDKQNTVTAIKLEMVVVLRVKETWLQTRP